MLEKSGFGAHTNQAILGAYQQIFLKEYIFADFSGSEISNIALYATLSHLTKL